ncbi:MAG: glycosyltransferase family 39 protein, partial [Candidatus Binatia bacterium]
MRRSGTTSFHAALAAVLMTATAVMTTAIVDVPFFTKGEPREALVVQQMVATGNPILPLRARGEIQSKPPLFHWLGLITSAAAGGVSETSVRVPSVAASSLVIALTAATALRTSGAGAALVSAVVLATSFLWLQASTIARVDMTLAAAVAVSLLAFERAWDRGRRRLPAAFWLAAAAGVLAKGPIGLLLPIGVVCTYLVARGEIRTLAEPRVLNVPAMALALVIPLVWYVPAALEGGALFVEKHVLDENLLRVIDAEGVGAGHVKPFWFYGPALLAGFAPWSPLLFPAVFDAWRRRGRLAGDGTLFALVWVVLTVALYSLAGSKRGIYLLSCYPALALLVGRWFATRFIDTIPVAPRPSLPTVAVVLPAVLVVVAASAVLLEAASVPALDGLVPVLSTNDAANLSAVSAAITSHRFLCSTWALTAIALAAALVGAGRAGRPVAAFSLVAVLVASTAATT